MIWEAVKEALKRNHTHFNFWGIAPQGKDNHPWTGLTNFKKKFTGFEQRWMISKDIPVSYKYYLTHVFEKIDAWRKGY
jgi:lipid II:glycine glycyltransferase (peptidoglycan interpeptide bridge formation enzyme)